jgi:hypothetical protein
VRDVAQIGAALGRQFSHELIGAVARMAPAQLDDALAQLVGAELIYRRGISPDAEYTSKNALVQDTAYGSLLRSRRQQLHAHIAATLEGRFPEIVGAQPALLAYHCEEGGLTEKAIDYWLVAGRQAWERAMLAEAVVLLRRGRALVPGLPDNDWRREREFDLQIALGQALSVFQSWSEPEAGEAYARAQQLAVAVNRLRDVLLALNGQWLTSSRPISRLGFKDDLAGVLARAQAVIAAPASGSGKTFATRGLRRPACHQHSSSARLRLISAGSRSACAPDDTDNRDVFDKDQIGRHRRNAAPGEADHQHARLPVDRPQRLVEGVAADRIVDDIGAPAVGQHAHAVGGCNASSRCCAMAPTPRKSCSTPPRWCRSRRRWISSPPPRFRLRTAPRISP